MQIDANCQIRASRVFASNSVYFAGKTHKSPSISRNGQLLFYFMLTSLKSIALNSTIFTIDLLKGISKIPTNMMSTTHPNPTTPLLREERSSNRSRNEETTSLAACNTTDHSIDDGDTASSCSGQWNESRINKWRLFATFFSFVVVGAIDGAYGVCILESLFLFLDPS